MTVRIVTDSGAALEPQVAAEHGVVVVPITLALDGRDYADGELSDEELDRRLDGPAPTAAPSPGAFLAAVKDTAAVEGTAAVEDTAAPGTDGAVIVTMAGRLSSTYSSATVAARMAGGETRVVDSGTAAGAQALVVFAAARAARDGADVDTVAQVATNAAAQVRLIGVLGSLDRLVQGGRVPGIVGTAGRMLHVQPMFELASGRVRPMRPEFSPDGASERLLSVWRGSRVPGAAAEVVVSHALAAERADALRRAVLAETTPRLLIVQRFGAALLAHAGAGTLGLSWRWVPAD